MAVGNVIAKPPQWMLALWARDSTEPAMLRVPIVIVVFVALWGLSMWILEKTRVPYGYALPIKSSNFAFIFSVAGFLISSYAVVVTLLSNSLGLSIEFGLLGFYGFFFVAHFLPLLQSPERGGFYRLLRLVFVPSSTISFAEVLLADAITSLSKVLKDLGTTLVAIYAQYTGLSILEYHNHAMLFIAVLASLPFWLRVRQCWTQLDSCPDRIAKIPVCLNILKYLSAFPAIWLTAAASLGYVHPSLPQYITVAATVNSLYSYGWDLIQDWGLLTFHRDMRVTRRPRTLFPWYAYLAAAIVNLLLRFSWTINRLPGMNHVHSSIIVLVIELGEVFRRAMWMIFRIEWETIVQQDKAAEKEPDVSEKMLVKAGLLL